MIAMKVTYLGSAAAEGIPGLFCECSFCENARRRGGKELRRRSGALIDDELLIDFSPDVSTGMLAVGKRLSDVRDVIITHSHEDHFCIGEIGYRRSPAYCILPDDRGPLRVYGNKAVTGALNDYYGDVALSRHGLDIRYVPPFVPFSAGAFTVTPLPVIHHEPEDSYIYLVEKGGVRLLYAHDTGIFPDAMFEYLKGITLDIVSLDCTMGYLPIEKGHMGFAANLKVQARLRENGCVKDDTVFISNHFSHNGLRSPDGDWTYEYFTEMAAPYGFIMSYDGMTAER